MAFLKKTNLVFGFLTFFLAMSFSCSGKSVKNAENFTKEVPGKTDFYVIFVNPEGELPSGIKNPSIQIMFSEPVVALEKLGEPTDKSDAVRIEPLPKGTFKWLGTSLLSFECEEAVIAQREYKIIVNPDLVSKNNNKISGKVLYKFYTEDLMLETIVPGFDGIEKNFIFPDDEVPLEFAKNVALYFSVPVDADYVKKFISVVESDTNRELKFKVTKKEKCSFNIEITSPLEKNKTIRVILKEGAGADKNSRGNLESQEKTFDTIKNLSVSWTDLDCQSYGKYSNPVKIFFNHVLKEDSEESVLPLISTEPEMPLTKENIRISGKYLMIFNLPVEYNSSYKLKIKSGVEDIYGLKTLEDSLFEVKVPKASSYARFKDYGFLMLESQFDPKIVFEHQNIVPFSRYSIKNIRGVTDNFKNPGDFEKVFSQSDIPENVRVIEEVPLKDYLEKIGDFYRGTINFSVDMKYVSSYKDWQTQKVVEKTYTSENSQYIQVTDLGISVRFGFNKALILVTRLSDGSAVENAEIKTYFVKGWKDQAVFETNPSYSLSGKTDKNGLAVINFDDDFKNLGRDFRVFFEARTKDDRVVFAPNGNTVFSENWTCGSPYDANSEKQLTFMFTDRGLYRPGEKVTFRGIDKNLKNEKYSEYCGDYVIELKDDSWKPKVYATLRGKTSESGTFWGSFVLPETLEPADYRICYRRSDSKIDRFCSVRVEYFERLQFEANSSIAENDYFSGDKISSSVAASYLGGGSLNGANYSASWVREPEGFSCKSGDFKNLIFGPTIGYEGRNWVSDVNGSLSALGTASVSVQTGGEQLKGMAYRYKMNANITDAGNQMISTSSSVLVHPALFYLGLSDIKNVNGFAKVGESLKFDYFCVTPQEKIASSSVYSNHAKLKIELMREEWKQVQQLGWNGEINTRYQREFVTDYSTEENLCSENKGKEFSVKPSKSGLYVLRLSTTDKFNREIITERRFYVTGSDWVWFNRESSSEITLTTDKTLYNPGENAQILMTSPLPKGKYLMTIEREGIIEEKVLDFDSCSSVLTIPVKEEYLPNVYVTLSSYSVRTKKPDHDFSTPDLDKPKGYFGSTILKVSTKIKQFDITVETEKQNYRPGEKAAIKVKATQNGKPLENAEITLMAVDRGVIDLIDYHVKDPVKFFYDQRNFLDYCRGGDSRSLLIDPVTYEIRNLFGGDAREALMAKAEDMQIRKNFDPTALFEPEVLTDENGEATVSFVLPDNLTSYRITAVGVKKDKFAICESEMKVSNPISVRSVLPRKLRPNDESEAGVIITNLTESEQKVLVDLAVFSGIEKTGYKAEKTETVKNPGLAKILGENEKQILIPANSTLPLMFKIKAQEEGWISLEFGVKSEILNEKLIKGLEIEKPYIYEQVATVGILDNKTNPTEKTEFVKIPSNIENNNGFLSINLDSSRLGPLSSAVDYVFHYPYGCLEQRSAAILPLVAFRNYISVLGLKSEVTEPEKLIFEELASWKKLQLDSGAFPYWPNGGHENLFVTLRIAEILALAEEHGYNMNEGADTEKLSSYIQNAISNLKNKGINRYNINNYAYAVYVLSRIKNKINISDIDLIAENRYADFSELCYAALAYESQNEMQKSDDVKKVLLKYIKETSRGVDITNLSKDYRWSWYSDSQTENLALALMYFSKNDTEAGLSSKILHSILSHESAKKGYFKSTSGTARVFVAVDSYIREKNLENTDFTSEAIFGENSLGSYKFDGLSTPATTIKADFSTDIIKNLVKDTDVPLKIKKDGTGFLYYTLLMKYELPIEQQIARDEGISVFNQIVDIESGKIVTNNTLESGKTYKMVVNVSSTKNRDFVALRVPIPGGAEILNADFATTGEIIEKSQKNGEEIEESEISLSNQEIYDNEVQYFWDSFYKGAKTVEFYFRATRKGTFNTPSVQAECMYEEEIFGRTKGNVWKIK